MRRLFGLSDVLALPVRASPWQRAANDRRGAHMFTRRTFIAGLSAGLAAPGVVSAKPTKGEKPFKLEKQFRPKIVQVRPEFEPGTIHVELARHFLYFVLEPEKAIRYGVAIGEEGRNFKGSAVVGRKAEWPSWTPTANMIRREPQVYAKWAGGLAGGPDNPLGARALYLGSSLYRIHGTNEPYTIGQNVSSGCIRMMNQDVEHLYERTPIGTKVIVIGPGNKQGQVVLEDRGTDFLRSLFGG